MDATSSSAVPSSDAPARPTESWRLDDLVFETFVEPRDSLGAARARVVAELLTLCRENTTFDASHLLVHEIDHATWLNVVRRAGAVVGFVMASLLELDGDWVLYLNFMVFGREARGRNLLTRQLEYLLRSAASRRNGEDFYLVSLSGNAQVVGAVHHYPWAYPRPGRATPPRLRKIARALATTLYPELRFDEEPPIVRKISPQDLSVHGLPRHRDRRVNEFCDRHLDYAAGDEIVLVGRIGLPQRLGIYAACRAALLRAWLRRWQSAR
ncbi:MAG: hypothetical protein ACHREM_28810 [Polyangiales bacterium]